MKRECWLMMGRSGSRGLKFEGAAIVAVLFVVLIDAW
jgi:hypothetical protein